MKKIFIILTISSIMLYSNPNLPTQSKSFISSTFKGVNILSVENNNNTFDVKLSNGIYIEFVGNGNWRKIYSESTDIPFSVLPIKISKSIKSQFNDKTIKEVEKRGPNFQVKLNNDIKLLIDKNGKIINKN